MRIILSLAIILSAACSGGAGDDTADVDALPPDAATDAAADTVDAGVDAAWACADRCMPSGGELREMCFGSTIDACVAECVANAPGVAWCPR